MPSPATNAAPLVSIIIRTYNEERRLAQCLESIFNQSVNFNFEIIIIDSGSSDNTLKIAARFKTKIITISKESFTYGRSLNLGFNEAGGEFLVSLSAHAIPQHNWLNHLIAGFADPFFAGVYSQQIATDSDCPLITRMLTAHHQKICRSSKPQLYFSNAGSMIKKSVWKKLPFIENLAASEDYDWAIRVSRAGYKIGYQPQAIINHWHKPQFKSIYQRNLREFASLLAINRKRLMPNLLILPGYNLIQDFIYIIANRLRPGWLLKSISANSALMAAATMAIIKQNVYKY